MGAHFKTPESEKAYTAFVQEVMGAWPVPYDEINVSGRFGKTHVVACGPMESPPLVLLHGFFTTLFLWAPNIADLSKTYRVYAIDIMGNRNSSIPSDAIGTEDEIIEWLDGTLTELGLKSFYLAGMSFGGWLGIKFALTQPERVKKLVLISPAASLQPLTKQFMPRVMLTILPPQQFWFRMLMGWMGVKGRVDSEFSQQLLDLMWLGAQYINTPAETMRVMPTVIPDTQLSALSMPVLLLIGEDEVIYDPQKALARAQQLIPDIKGELVPQCGHDISFTQHRIVDDRMLTFLAAG